MLEFMIVLNGVLTLVAVGLLAAVFVRSRGGREGEALAPLLDRFETRLRDEMARLREGQDQGAARLRDGLAAQGNATAVQLGEALKSFATQFGESHRLVAAEQQRHIEQFRASLDASLAQVREETRRKLDEIRQMVDQRLQQTLETRLGESFRTVSEQLKVVHQGLGEMQALASGVGDLKRVLSGVKVRGLWGEAHLKALLDQVLAPGQYEENVATRPGSGERVEFAIRLPGPDPETTAWLPVDAKFPLEDYERLVHASDANDPAGVEEARKALHARIRACAKDVHDKYLDPPHTTAVAILYLPIEGLYAEIVQSPGLVSAIHQDFQVLVAGPTTLAALLNTFQMGFRTLAIQRRSQEIWRVLGAIKTEFAKFGEALDKVGKKLAEAQNTLETSQTRKRVMERRLREVETLPEGEAAAVLEVEDLPGSSERGSSHDPLH